MTQTMSPAAQHFLDRLNSFSARGLTGLADHADRVNKLGELLASGDLPAEALQQFIFRHQPLVGGEAVEDLQGYWSVLWSRLLGRDVQVPPVPNLKPKTSAALREYGFKVMFIPVITEADYPDFFVKPAWGRYLTETAIKRFPLPGKWVAVETIARPRWNAPGAYGAGEADKLARVLGLETRFSQSWDDIAERHKPKLVKLLGLSQKAVRLPTAEEWNLIGNLFNWLREEQGESLPDLGATNSWEWCENAYYAHDRVIVGHAEGGGLEAVDYHWQYGRSYNIGFRVLAVL